LAARDKSGFGTMAAFTQQPVLQTSNLDNNGLSMKSDYFLLNAMAEFDNSRSQQFSLLWRENGIVKVIMRGQGAY
ncbi:MAG: type II secretion system protein GspK, partial [Pseudomonadota bacterium]|nr:type II secretion system protein GspK [Pseudomonadota bacterium]